MGLVLAVGAKTGSLTITKRGEALTIATNAGQDQAFSY